MTRGNPVSFKLLAGLVAALSALAPVGVQAQAGPEACAAVVADGERLACYDALFRPAGAATDTDAIVVSSERLIPALPSGREPATMSIACVEARPQVSFAFAGQLVSNTSDIAPVTFQVDQGGTTVRTLNANDDNDVLSFAAGRDSIAFLDSLIGGNNLKVRMTPVRQRSLTVDFRLPAVIDEIAALRASCR